MNTDIASVSIVNGRGFLEGDIRVGSEGALFVRNFLSSRYGALVSSEDLGVTSPDGSQSSLARQTQQALGLLKEEVIAQAFEHRRFGDPALDPPARERQVRLLAQIEVAFDDVMRSFNEVGVFSTGIPANGGIWPGGRIPFVLDPSVQGKAQDIQNAMTCWRNASGGKINLVPRETKDANYIKFTLTNESCSSEVGMSGKEQIIEINPNCPVGTIAHEIGHALGLYHEQTHPQRDNFVEIKWDEIEGWARGNFEMAEGARGLTEYDFTSIMHYPADAFSKSNPPQPTIVPKAGVDPAQMGQRKALKPKDIAGAAALYGFPAKAEEEVCPGAS